MHRNNPLKAVNIHTLHDRIKKGDERHECSLYENIKFVSNFKGISS